MSDFPQAVTTKSLAEVLRGWLARGGPDDPQRTLTWLEEASGVSKRKLRSIVAEEYATTREEIADRITAAIDRPDLYSALEFVDDGRATRRTGQRKQKVSCLTPVVRAKPLQSVVEEYDPLEALL